MTAADWLGAGICVVLMVFTAAGTVARVRDYRRGDL